MDSSLLRNRLKKDYHLRPRLLFVVTLGIVFLVELFVMHLLHLLPGLSRPMESFLDACLLSVLVVPFLYYLFLKPLYLNIDERQQKEVERHKLELVDNLKNEFISTAAHELRTPVATIMGFTELLSDQHLIGPVSHQQRTDFLNEIYKNSERLSKLVDDILDVSRIESGQRIPLDKKLCATGDILKLVVERFRLKAACDIQLEIKSSTPESVEVDAHRIDQVLENLIDNAIKYSPGESRVMVVSESDVCGCKVSIVDYGIGMTNEQQARIYEKFYRANTSNTAIQGLGLGMCIAKQIIEDHGGTIRVVSEHGKGTEVSFTLPV